MTHTVARLRIAREIQEAEVALDEALLRQSSLFSTLVSARRETGVDAFTGHDALLRLAKSQQSLLDAGSNLARVHGRLLEIGREVGGFDDECPPPAGLTPHDAGIRAA
jgi:hypothetical protein